MAVFLMFALVGGVWSTSYLDRFTLGEKLSYRLDRKLGASDIQSGRYGGVKILNTTGIRTPDSLIVQSVDSLNSKRGDENQLLIFTTFFIAKNCGIFC
jgi:hypothetical protein